MVKKKITKVEYKIWTLIEKHTEYSDGSESYRDLKQEEPRSLGTFSTLEKANEQVNLMGDIHQYDSDEDI